MSTFLESAELTLLRTELERMNERYTAAAYERQQATEMLGRYLNTLFPAAYAQAMARRIPVHTFAQEMLRALTLVQPYDTTGAAAAADEPAAAAVETPPTSTPSSPPPLTADQISFLRLCGANPDYEIVRRAWCAEAQQDESAFKTCLDTLIEAQLLTLHTLSASGNWTTFYAPHLIDLSAAGQAEYQQRFGLPPCSIAEFIKRAYKSEEAWYLIRVVREIILAGGTLPTARFVPAAVLDTAEPLPAPYQRRYGNSEPDLIVELRPPDGVLVRVAIECERGLYTAAALKMKVLKSLRDYAAHGFDGVYYVAPNRDTGSRIKTAIRKVTADLRDNPQAIERGFIALFAVDDLLHKWLPSPAMLNRWHGPPPEEFESAAAADYCFKHRYKGADA